MNTAIVIWYIGATFAAGWFMHKADKDEEKQDWAWGLAVFVICSSLWPLALGGEFHRVLTEGKESSK